MNVVDLANFKYGHVPYFKPKFSSGATICSGTQVTLSATGGKSYLWSNSATDSSIVVTPKTTTTYSITVFNPLGCSVTDSITVLVPLSAVTVNGANSICAGNIITLSVSGTGITSYSWNTGSASSSISVSPDTTTFYSVVVANAFCKDTISKNVIVNSLPVPVISSMTNACAGSSKGSADIIVNGGTPSYSYSWNSGQSSQNVNSLAGGIYTITVTDKNGCSDTTSVKIASLPLPFPVISSFINACGGNGSANVIVTGGTPGYIFSWSNGQTTQNATGLSVGTYAITVTDKNGCSDTTAVHIASGAVPIVVISGGGAVVEGKSTQLNATSGMISYSWTPEIGLSCSTCFNPIATPDVNTNYCVFVVDSNNCSNEICTEIDIQCGDVFVPSAFSPNGDGQNDVLFVRGKCIQSFSFLVFDRWGEKVFESENLAYGWDGKYNSQPCSAGAYTFYMKGTMFDGSAVTKMGSVILVR
jgi:gliding motility-associated-like protein